MLFASSSASTPPGWWVTRIALFRNRAVAEEVIQEVFLRVYRVRGAYEPKARFTTWLYTIASRACLNELRRRRSRPEDLEAPELSDARAIPAPVLEPIRCWRVARWIRRCSDVWPGCRRTSGWLWCSPASATTPTPRRPSCWG